MGAPGTSSRECLAKMGGGTIGRRRKSNRALAVRLPGAVQGPELRGQGNHDRADGRFGRSAYFANMSFARYAELREAA